MIVHIDAAEPGFAQISFHFPPLIQSIDSLGIVEANISVKRLSLGNYKRQKILANLIVFAGWDTGKYFAPQDEHTAHSVCIGVGCGVGLGMYCYDLPVAAQLHYIGIGIFFSLCNALHAHGVGFLPPGLLHDAVIDVAEDVTVDKEE